MSAKKIYGMVIGLIVLGLIEGIIKAAWATFPLELVFGFHGLVLGSAITSKLTNDRNEMKYGIMPEKPCVEAPPK